MTDQMGPATGLARPAPGLPAAAIAALLTTDLVGVAVVDRDMRVQEINRRGTDIMAASHDRIVGRLITDFVPLPEAGERVRTVVGVMADGRPVELDAQVLRGDGTSETIRATLLPVVEADGTTGDRIAVMARIVPPSEDRILELQRHLREYGELAAEADEPMWRITRVPEFAFTYMNPAGERLFDVTLQELREDPDVVLARVHPEDRERLLAGRKDPAGEIWPMQLRWRRRDGQQITVEVREIPVFDDDGAVVASLGLAREVGGWSGSPRALQHALQQQQEVAEHLRRIDEMRRAFLRAVSHELRTPLTAVVGYAETLKTHRTRLSDEGADELVDRLIRNAVRLRGLLDDLLDIDRLSRGTFAIDLRQADLAEVVLGAVDATDHRLGQVRVNATPTTCWIDPPKIERILDNLVGNALKHGGREVTVWVSVRQEGGHAVLEVADDGPGVDDELKDRVFLPFEQGRASASAASPGTGMGLTLVREFARLHHGSVEVLDREGGGAVFTVRLPLEGPPDNRVADPAPRS